MDPICSIDLKMIFTYINCHDIRINSIQLFYLLMTFTLNYFNNLHILQFFSEHVLKEFGHFDNILCKLTSFQRRYILVLTASTCSLEYSLASISFLTLFDTRVYSSLICLYQQYSSESSIKFLILESLETRLGITRVFKKRNSSQFLNNNV